MCSVIFLYSVHIVSKTSEDLYEYIHYLTCPHTLGIQNIFLFFYFFPSVSKLPKLVREERAAKKGEISKLIRQVSSLDRGNA